MMDELRKDSFSYDSLYRGKVVDNNDPSKLGRVRVNVFELFDGIATSDLPWAVPMQPVGPGAGAGYGVFSVPEVDSIVFVMFEGGDVNQPVYVGSAPDGVHGLPSENSTNYPHRMIIKTKSGVVAYIDDTDQKIRVSNASGKYIEMDSNGNVTISAGKVDIIAGEVDVSGDLKVDGEVRSDTVFNITGVPGVNGTFTSKDNKIVTVQGGLTTQII